MWDALKTYYAIHSKTSEYTYEWNSPVFLFSNENISQYLDPAMMRGARVLSVCGSGDHVFESLLAGAAAVDTFDINYLQKYVLELKTKMIRGLSYENFMDFFYDYSSPFNQKILGPVMPELTRGARVFARYAFTKRVRPSLSIFGIRPSYLQDKVKYAMLKNILPKEFKFSQIDVRQLPQILDRRYRVILLSNIMRISTLAGFDAYYRQVLKPLAQAAVTDQGQIYFNYLFSESIQDQGNVIKKNYIDPLLKLDPQHTIEFRECTPSNTPFAGFPLLGGDVAVMMKVNQKTY